MRVIALSRTTTAFVTSLVVHAAFVGAAAGVSWRGRNPPQLAYVAVEVRDDPGELAVARLGEAGGERNPSPAPMPAPAPRRSPRRRQPAPAAAPSSVADEGPAETAAATAPAPSGEPLGTGALVAAVGSATSVAVGGGSARFVPEAIARAQRLSGADPAFPPSLVRAGVAYVVQAKLCVTIDGAVDRVTILKHADPALDASVAAATRGWRYRPLLIDGRPAPFCTFVRFEFRGE
jgi:outer membrane biosynthesis protein TonB